MATKSTQSEGKTAQRRHEVATIASFPSGSGERTSEWLECGWASYAGITIDVTAFTRPDTDETLDVYIQGSWDGGSTIHGLARFQTTTAGAQQRIIELVGPFASNAPITPSAKGVTANTKVDTGVPPQIRAIVELTDPANADAVCTVKISAALQA